MKDFFNKMFGAGNDIMIAEQDFMYNYKHLIIVFCVMAFVIFFSMLYFRKKHKTQKIFLILSGVFLLLFEVARMLWNYFHLKLTSAPNAWDIMGLDLFTVSNWLSIIFLFMVAIIGEKRRISQLMLNYIFTVTAVAAIINIAYPDGLIETLPIYNIYNLQFLFSRGIILLVALFLGASDWLDNSLDDVWMAILNLIFMFGLGAAIFYGSGEVVDIIFIKDCYILAELGINVASPWHIFIVSMFFFGIQVFMYLPFDVYRKIKYRHWKPAKF